MVQYLAGVPAKMAIEQAEAACTERNIQKMAKSCGRVRMGPVPAAEQPAPVPNLLKRRHHRGRPRRLHRGPRADVHAIEPRGQAAGRRVPRCAPGPVDHPPAPRARRVPGRGRGCRCGEGGRRSRGCCCRGGPPAPYRALGRRRCGRDGRVRGCGLHELGGEARVARKARRFHGRRVGDLNAEPPMARVSCACFLSLAGALVSPLRRQPGFSPKIG